MKIKHIVCFAILLSIGLTSCSTSSIASPTPTSTSVSTNTPALTNTPLPTATATPVAAINLEKQSDGTWLYCDNEAGFQFQMGKNWYFEDVSTLDIGEIFERTSKIKTELGLKNIPQYFLEPTGMRIIGVYLDEAIPDYMSAAFNAAHIVDDGFAQMPLQDIQNRIIEILSTNYNKEPKEFHPKIVTNGHGLEYGTVIFNLALNYLQMKIFFKTHDGIGMITFGFSDQNIDIFGPDWTLLTNSLQYTAPSFLGNERRLTKRAPNGWKSPRFQAGCVAAFLMVNFLSPLLLIHNRCGIITSKAHQKSFSDLRRENNDFLGEGYEQHGLNHQE